MQFDPTSLVLIAAAVALAPILSAASLVGAGLVSVLVFLAAPAVALRPAARAAAPSAEAPA